MTLQSHATVDTWQGPCAQACNENLATAQRSVHLAIDDLGSRAWRFDRHADELEVAAIEADRRREREAADPPPPSNTRA